MAPIAVSLEPADPAVGIVTLLGEHDAYSAGRLENELAVLVESGLRVVVDLSEATFVDSQTLSVLLSAKHAADARGGAFVLVLPHNAYTQVHRILDMTGLISAFAVRSSLADAVAVARSPATEQQQLRVA